VLFYKSETPNLTVTATITLMGWLRSNLHIAQIGTYLTHPLSVFLFLLLLSTNGTLTHFNSVHFQLTCNQQDKTPESTSLLCVLPLTHSTLVPNPFTKNLDTLTLNEFCTEHRDTQRSSKARSPTACYTHYKEITIHTQMDTQPATPIEIFSEILLKDLFASEINIDLPVGSFQ